MRVMSSRCLHCDARLPDGRIQPHCLAEDCNLGFAHHMAAVNVRQDGECEVWAGRYTSAGTPVVVVRVADNGTRAGVRRDYRVLDLRFQKAGKEPANHRRFRSLCGTTGCVLVAHHEVIRATHDEPAGLRGRLPAEPLLRRAAVVDRPMPDPVRKYLEKARTVGWVTVGKADEICCDYLRCHPVELYGEEFFTA